MPTDDPSSRAMRSFPVSLIMLPVAIGAYLIQVLPIPGVFVMLLMAFAWPILCVYAAMLGTIGEVVGRRVSAWWLLLPLGSLALYEAAALRDHLQARREIGEAHARNAGVKVPFSASTSDLVLDRELSYPQRLDPAWAVAATTLPVVYQRTQVAGPRQPRYESYRATSDGQCEAIKALKLDVRTSRLEDPERGSGYSTRKLGCLLTMEENPERPMTVVSRSVAEETSWGMPIARGTVTITTPDGRRATLRSAQPSPLSWIPFFFAGCGLNSGNPSWDCARFFARTPIRPGGGDSFAEMKTLTTALGLTMVTLADGGRPADPAVLETMKSKRRQEIAAAFELAELAMRDPSTSIVSGTLDPMLDDPDRLQAFLPVLINWTGRHLSAPPRKDGQGSCNMYIAPDSAACLRTTAISRTRSFVEFLRKAEDIASDTDKSAIRELSDAYGKERRRSAEASRERRRLKAEARTREARDQMMRVLMMQQQSQIARDPSRSETERRNAILQMQELSRARSSDLND